MTDSQAPTTNPVAPVPAGVRTAADVVTPEVLAQLVRGVVGSGLTANHTPSTGEKLADLPESTPEDVAEAFARARAAQPVWAATSVRRRAAVLLRFHDLLLERQAEVLDLVQRRPARRGCTRTRRSRPSPSPRATTGSRRPRI